MSIYAAGTRNIAVGDRMFTFVGRLGDPYFEGSTLDACSFFNFALRRMPVDATIFDVGANIGMTTVKAKAICPQATVYCFEPDPQAFGFLARNIAGNGLDDCHIFEVALSDHAGRSSFFSNPISASASHLISDVSGDHTVNLMTLDQFIESHYINRLDLIKIDVEGFEANVLAGAARSIGKFKPMAIVEFNAFTLLAFKAINPRDFLDLLIAQFPFIYAEDRHGLYRISDGDSIVKFLHAALIEKHCVDDLLCTFIPIS